MRRWQCSKAERQAVRGVSAGANAGADALTRWPALPHPALWSALWTRPAWAPPLTPVVWGPLAECGWAPRYPPPWPMGRVGPVGRVSRTLAAPVGGLTGSGSGAGWGGLPGRAGREAAALGLAARAGDILVGQPELPAVSACAGAPHAERSVRISTSGSVLTSRVVASSLNPSFLGQSSPFLFLRSVFYLIETDGCAFLLFAVSLDAVAQSVDSTNPECISSWYHTWGLSQWRGKSFFLLGPHN